MPPRRCSTDNTLPNAPIIDLVRVFGIVVTGIVMVLAWRITIKAVRPYDVPLLWALTIYWLFAILQEFQQLGKPFVWWRLPMLLAAAFCAAESVRRRL